jgi:hypothetical protein
LIVGDLRISTLTADGLRSTCGFGPRAQPLAAGTARPATLGLMGITSLALTGATSPEDASAIHPPLVDSSVEIERLVVRVEGVSIGDANLVEPFEWTAEGFSVDPNGVRIRRADAKVESGTVTYAGQTVLDNLSVSFRASSVQVGPETGAGNELHATLEITNADVRALPGPPTEAPTAVEGTLRANLTWRGAHLASGSSLNVSLNPFAWSHEGGGVTQFEKTSVVSAVAFAADDGRLTSVEWQAQSPSMRHGREPGLSATVRDVSLRVRYETLALLLFDQPGNFSMRAGGLSLRRGEQVLMADGASVEGRLCDSAGSAQTHLFNSATLTLTGARLVDDQLVDQQTVGARFSAEVRLEAARPTDAYSGNVIMRGQDAGVILILANSGELPSWITSKFYGEPFSLEAALELQHGVVRVSDLELERGALTLRGWWRLDPENSDGALLMDYGGLHVGIVGGQPGRLTMRANQEWLQSRPPPEILSGVVEP